MYSSPNGCIDIASALRKRAPCRLRSAVLPASSRKRSGLRFRRYAQPCADDVLVAVRRLELTGAVRQQ